MRKIFILPLIILPLLSFADSEIPDEIPITAPATPSPGPITTSNQSPPPTTTPYRGGPSAADLAAEKAAKCAAVPQILKEAGEAADKCVGEAIDQRNMDQPKCSLVKLSTVTTGLTVAEGVTIGRSSVSVSGMTPTDCVKMVEGIYSSTVKDLCEGRYTRAKDYANAMKEQYCPK